MKEGGVEEESEIDMGEVSDSEIEGDLTSCKSPNHRLVGWVDRTEFGKGDHVPTNVSETVFDSRLTPIVTPHNWNTL